MSTSGVAKGGGGGGGGEGAAAQNCWQNSVGTNLMVLMNF